MLICDQQAKTISCPPPSKITITSAFYGRLNKWGCFTGFEGEYKFNPSSACIACGAKDVVSAQCNNQQNCAVTALPYKFASSFSVQCNVSKYVCICYKCVQTSYMGEPVFYRWDGVGLSVVTGENLVTYRAADIEPFAIHNQQYVAVANYVNDQDLYHLDSKLYMCNALSGRFNSLQKL